MPRVPQGGTLSRSGVARRVTIATEAREGNMVGPRSMRTHHKVLWLSRTPGQTCTFALQSSDTHKSPEQKIKKKKYEIYFFFLRVFQTLGEF